MIRKAFVGICGVAVSLVVIGTAYADTYPVILQGKVTMSDGSPPPFQASIERICSDAQGGTPGPLTNKKGEWIWRLEIDAFASRSCYFRASHQGYTSTITDASNLNTTSHATTLTIPTLVLVPSSPDPYAIRITDDNIPGKARGNVSKAMKALDTRNYAEAAQELQAAVAAAPKFAEGWHALGVIDETLLKPEEAREAYNHAIEANPKSLTTYVTLTRTCLKLKDWMCAVNTANTLIKLDTKKIYVEIYLHRAVAQYQLNDLSGAEQSVQEALRTDSGHKRPRAEYVLGRILEAKGDVAGAREHFARYLELDPSPADLALVKAHVENVGKPPIPEAEPVLEPLQ
jgi:Tfp pilus assembly protein PilF